MKASSLITNLLYRETLRRRTACAAHSCPSPALAWHEFPQPTSPVAREIETIGTCEPSREETVRRCCEIVQQGVALADAVCHAHRVECSHTHSMETQRKLCLTTWVRRPRQHACEHVRSTRCGVLSISRHLMRLCIFCRHNLITTQVHRLHD